MREIKFRAWLQNHRDPRMIFFDLREEELNVGYLIDKGSPIMQYTNLKDKNGVEIYEGDIVQVWYGDQKDSRPTEVKWDGYSFYPFINGCAGCETYADRAMSPFTPDPSTPYLQEYTVEVIGNIYENPELLK